MRLPDRTPEQVEADEQLARALEAHGRAWQEDAEERGMLLIDYVTVGYFASPTDGTSHIYSWGTREGQAPHSTQGLICKAQERYDEYLEYIHAPDLDGD